MALSWALGCMNSRPTARKSLVTGSRLEKVVGLTGFVFVASFSPAQGERNQIVNAKFTRPVNAMHMSNWMSGKNLEW